MMRGATAQRARGFTLLGLMFVVALLSLSAAMANLLWSTEHRRENERELVFAGRQYQAAIERYRQRASGPAAQYPRRLQDLLRDPRAPALQRDLRRLYPDPITGEPQWGLVRLPDGGIVGVYSLSERAPLQRSLVAAGLAFPLATSYRDWRFVAPSAAGLAGMPRPPAASASAPAKSPSPPGAMSGTPNDVPDDAPIAAVPRPSQQDYRDRTPEACARIAAHDDQVCREQAARHGEEAGAACQESAVQRAIACPSGDGEAVPALTVED